MLCLPEVLLIEIYSSLKIKDKYNFFKSNKNICILFHKRFKKKYFPVITAIKQYFDSKIISLLGGTLIVLEYPLLKFHCRIQEINSIDLPESINLGIMSHYPDRKAFVAFKIVKNYTYNDNLLFLEKDNNVNNIEGKNIETCWKFYTYERVRHMHTVFITRTPRFGNLEDILPKFIQNEIVETEKDTYFHIL